MLTPLTPHMSQDFLYYFAFLGGQLLFILKRAASAIRSKTNPVKTRRAFIYANWDVLLIRCAIEFPIYFFFRHYDANSILSVFTSWRVPFTLPQGGMMSFSLGYIADSLLDWFGASAKAPDWLKENIPSVQVFSSHSEQTGTDAAGSPVTITKDVTVVKP
jgi:hypothetical protein